MVIERRMQMFCGAESTIKPWCTSPKSLIGSYAAKLFFQARVDLPVAFILQSDLVLYLDSVGNNSQACSAPTNSRQ
jgi:hypothetical protein